MKKIAFNYSFSIDAKPQEKVDFTPKLLQELQVARANRLHVIEAALMIEGFLEELLTVYFFGHPERSGADEIKSFTFSLSPVQEALIEFSAFPFRCAQPSPRRSEFSTKILKSQWCSFGAKIKLLESALVDVKSHSAREAKDLCNALKKVMLWRNAFTHGAIAYKGDSFYLKYFHETERSEALTDEFLTKVQSAIRDAIDLVAAIGPPLGPFSHHADMRQNGERENEYEVSVDGGESFVVDLNSSPRGDNPV